MPAIDALTEDSRLAMKAPTLDVSGELGKSNDHVRLLGDVYIIVLPLRIRCPVPLVHWVHIESEEKAGHVQLPLGH